MLLVRLTVRDTVLSVADALAFFLPMGGLWSSVEELDSSPAIGRPGEPFSSTLRKQMDEYGYR
jgi:hypothetical protein